MASALLAAALVAGRGPVVWAPQPGSQSLFLRCPIAECVYDGTRGPGKSDALLMDFAKDVGRGYGEAWRGILFRESYPQLSDIVRRSKRWFYQIFPDARFVKSGPDGYSWEFSEGETLSFRYMETPDDYWNYHGHEYPWIGWEEITNWPTLDCYHSMKACWRSSIAGVPRRYRATTNPFGVGHHEVKAYIVDPAPPGVPITNEEGLQRIRIHGHWSENRKLLEADPNYVKNLASDTNINRRKAWLLGDWDIVAGGFFDDVWDRSKHVVRPFQIPHSWRVDRSFDWGSSRPFSVGWWAESDGTTATMADGSERSFPRGTLFRISEWYGMQPSRPNVGTKMLAVDIAKGVLERDRELRFLGVGQVKDGPADPSIYAVENGQSIALDMEKAGVKWTRGDNSPGSRKNGWERMRKYFAASLESRPESPGLYVFDTCVDFIRTVPVLPRHKVKLDDIDSSSEDHIADETRYRLLAPPPPVWGRGQGNVVSATKGETAKQPREPNVALDYVASKYLEDVTTGGQLTPVQRDLFLELARNPSELERYARQGSTDVELASILSFPVTAIEVFAPVLAKSRALLNNRIRDQLLKAGDRGEPAALTYLAKVYLDGAKT